MTLDSVLYETVPGTLRLEEKAIFDTLNALNIPFVRASHDYAATMDDCLAITKLLGAPVFKNLFLCTRNESAFYLLLMPAEKPFKTKYLSEQIHSSRLSFAQETQLMDKLHAMPGSASPLELIFDRERRVQLLIDMDLTQSEYVCCHPGYAENTVKILFADLIRYVEHAGHAPLYVTLPNEVI